MLGWVIFLAVVTFLGIAVLLHRRDQEREKRRNEVSGMLGVRPKGSAPPAPAKDTKPTLNTTRPAKRDERGYEIAATAPQNRECTLSIDYVDAIGVCTTRLIAPYKSGNTNVKFDAWCATRQARRTFYFERIQSAVHVYTGIRMDRAGVFRHIHPDRRVPRDLM